jgi:hypothetical protein
MKQKPAILRGPFPTVEDTAKLLGVSQRRLNRLLRLVDSKETVKEHKHRVLAAHKVSEAKGKRAATKKRIATALRKRRTRRKTAEAHA